MTSSALAFTQSQEAVGLRTQGQWIASTVGWPPSPCWYEVIQLGYRGTCAVNTEHKSNAL